MCRGEKQYPYGSSWHLGGLSSGAVTLLALGDGQWQQQPWWKKAPGLMRRQDWAVGGD